MVKWEMPSQWFCSASKDYFYNFSTNKTQEGRGAEKDCTVTALSLDAGKQEKEMSVQELWPALQTTLEVTH